MKAHSAVVTKVASVLLQEETLLSDRFLQICSESGKPVAGGADFTPSQAAAPVKSTMVGRKLIMPVCDPERFIAGVIELERPLVVFSLIQPVGVQAAIVRGVQDFLLAIAVQVGDDGVGQAVLDDVVVFAERRRIAVGGGRRRPRL